MNDQLFALNPECAARMELVGGRIPVLVADDFYADPDAVRAHALSLPFAPPPYPYPGRLAEIDEANRRRVDAGADATGPVGSCESAQLATVIPITMATAKLETNELVRT